MKLQVVIVDDSRRGEVYVNDYAVPVERRVVTVEFTPEQQTILAMRQTEFVGEVWLEGVWDHLLSGGDQSE